MLEPPALGELLDRARSGEEPAFGLIYRDLQPLLLRYLSVRSPDTAEDACAETWLEVARSLPKFRGDGATFRAWVFTIARGKLVDQIRWEARRPLSVVGDMADLEVTMAGSAGPESGVDPAVLAETQESTRRAVAMVRTLAPDQAEALMLTVVAGLEYSEAASVMERSVGAVRVLVHRGLRRLARTVTLGQSDESAEVNVGRV